MNLPFAEAIRPSNLSDIVGQDHISGKGKLIDALIEKKRLINLIFFGPPGTGKTTVANIISHHSNVPFYHLNATYSNTQNIKDITSQVDTLIGINGLLIYIDEIHNFNKKQQQLLLEHIEKGKIYLIASTTENPYHHVYKSLLSRCSILEFYPLSNQAIRQGIDNALSKLKIQGVSVYTEDRALESLTYFSNGDLRKALNIIGIILDLFSNDNQIRIDTETLQKATSSKSISYDKNSDEHYNLLSAFQKSIRGSDCDAALHYLARIIEADDIISITRRLLVIASEDIGLAYPNAITIVKSCVDSAMTLGFPEARIPLAQATILLCTSPKSNSAMISIDKAIQEIRENGSITIPDFLKDGHYSGATNLGHVKGYLYPHDYPNNFVPQQYLPTKLIGKKYYSPGNNKMEMTAEFYMKKIKRNESNNMT